MDNWGRTIKSNALEYHGHYLYARKTEKLVQSALFYHS